MRQLERHIETLSLGRREERKERREGGQEKGREGGTRTQEVTWFLSLLLKA